MYKRIIQEWSGDRNLDQKVITLFEKVRDIPYGQIGSSNPQDVYTQNKGTCSGKHTLLKNLYEELDIPTKSFVIRHHFNDLDIDYPPDVKEILKKTRIADFHNFLKIKRKNKWIMVDATWDKPLKKYGFPVTENWDGKSNTEICVAVGESIFETTSPNADKSKYLKTIPKQVRRERKIFLKKLNRWLEKIRE